MVDFSHRPQSAKPLRRPNSSRRLRPGFSPGNTELIPAQATPRASARGTARTGPWVRLVLGRLGSRFPSRCCAASAGLSCPEIRAPQYVQTTRASRAQDFLTGTVKATCYAIADGTNPHGAFPHGMTWTLGKPSRCAPNSRASVGPAPGPLPGVPSARTAP